MKEKLFKYSENITDIKLKETLDKFYGLEKIRHLKYGYRSPLLQKQREQFYARETINGMANVIFTESQKKKAEKLSKLALKPDDTAGLIEVFEENRKYFELASLEEIYEANFEDKCDGESMFYIIHEFFKTCTHSKRPAADAFLACNYLTEQGLNVDFTDPDDRVKIHEGKITFLKNGRITCQGYILGKTPIVESSTDTLPITSTTGNRSSSGDSNPTAPRNSTHSGVSNAGKKRGLLPQTQSGSITGTKKNHDSHPKTGKRTPNKIKTDKDGPKGNKNRNVEGRKKTEPTTGEAFRGKNEGKGQGTTYNSSESKKINQNKTGTFKKGEGQKTDKNTHDTGLGGSKILKSDKIATIKIPPNKRDQKGKHPKKKPDIKPKGRISGIGEIISRSIITNPSINKKSVGVIVAKKTESAPKKPKKSTTPHIINKKKKLETKKPKFKKTLSSITTPEPAPDKNQKSRRLVDVPTTDVIKPKMPEAKKEPIGENKDEKKHFDKLKKKYDLKISNYFHKNPLEFEGTATIDGYTIDIRISQINESNSEKLVKLLKKLDLLNKQIPLWGELFGELKLDARLTEQDVDNIYLIGKKVKKYKFAFDISTDKKFPIAGQSITVYRNTKHYAYFYDDRLAVLLSLARNTKEAMTTIERYDRFYLFISKTAIDTVHDKTLNYRLNFYPTFNYKNRQIEYRDTNGKMLFEITNGAKYWDYFIADKYNTRTINKDFIKDLLESANIYIKANKKTL